MPTFIKPGFWVKTRKQLEGYLNLDLLIESKIPIIPHPIEPNYKTYVANISMSTGEANVFENTLGVTPIWTVSTGSIGTSVSSLIGQTNVYINVSSGASSSLPKIVSAVWTPSPWNILIRQIDFEGTQDSTQTVYVEIKLYN
jgi:hypothetical protein